MVYVSHVATSSQYHKYLRHLDIQTMAGISESRYYYFLY